MSYDDKYLKLAENFTTKEIGVEADLKGFILKPFCGIKDDGSCAGRFCNGKGKVCKKPGKQPIKNRSGACSVESFIEICNAKPYTTVGTLTGYNPKTNMTMGVVDVDRPGAETNAYKILPSIKNTFTNTTARAGGLHFHFAIPGNVKLGKIINFQDQGFDLLVGSNHGVIWPGGKTNPRKILKNIPVVVLSPEEVNNLKSIFGKQANKLNNSAATKSRNPQKKLDSTNLVDMFYANKIKRGNYNNALFAVAAKQLRSKVSNVLDGKYPREALQAFLVEKAKKHLDKPNLDEVELIATRARKTFQAGKVALPYEDLCKEVFKYSNDSTKTATLNVIQNLFKISNHSTPKNSVKSNSLKDVKELTSFINCYLSKAKIKSINIQPDKLMRLVRHFHPNLKKIRLDNIVGGKRITKKTWNLSLVESNDNILGCVQSPPAPEGGCDFKKSLPTVACSKKTCSTLRATRVVKQHKTDPDKKFYNPMRQSFLKNNDTCQPKKHYGITKLRKISRLN